MYYKLDCYIVVAFRIPERMESPQGQHRLQPSGVQNLQWHLLSEHRLRRRLEHQGQREVHC